MDQTPTPHPTPSEAPNFDGERYYLAAIALTDSNPGTQFREMLTHDASVGQAARLYFQGEWRDLPLMGWNTFCLRMEETGQRDWLSKIKSLDNDVMLSHLEQQILTAQRSADKPNRSLLESAVKALQGVAAMTKIEADKQELGSANIPLIEVRFIPSLDRPVEPEEWERILAEKDPELVEYFGLTKGTGEKDAN